MVDSEQIKIPSLAEQWSLHEEQQPGESEPSIETTNEDEQSAESTDGAVLEEKIDETPTAEESTDETPTVDESTAADGSDESTEEAADAAEVEEDAEEQPEIKIETAPADFRFPTTNQTRHCFTRYIEYHRCIAAKGDEAPECDKFAKYYRSLCPGEWIERWNEQRENGTFPGPL